MHHDEPPVRPASADPSLWNPDLAPTSPAQRTWGTWHIAALWIGMAVCIPTYTLAAGLLSSGMSWWGAVLTVLVGNVMVAARSQPDVVVAQASTSDAEAVQILTNRIIHVESGGSATAKNPNSSATGLGQFISKTWIRMMNTYRPDLARSLSTKELLALRFDPTISREMVANLAREGEAYLKQRGHAITAGRLYLCHFLGMEGAHLVLSATKTEPLINVIGAQAINANRFLTGKDASYVIDWAERKMRGARATAPATSTQSPPTVIEDRPLSPEFEKFKMAVSEIVKALDDGI